MITTAIINYKGGVGKTSLTANLAGQLAWTGKKVLLLDMDPQTSLTFSFVTPEYWDKTLQHGKTIKSWFDALQDEEDLALEDLVITPNPVNQKLQRSGNGGIIDLIPSHLALINVDMELATLLAGANMQQSRKKFLKVHSRLSAGIASLDEDKYDYCLIDCPPNFNIVTKNAIVAADNILIPTKADYLSTLGIDYLVKNVKSLVKEFNEYAEYGETDIAATIAPQTLGVAFTMVSYYGGQPISGQRPFIAKTKALGQPVFTAPLRENKTIYADAPQYGVPVVLNHYGTDTHNNVVNELEVFAKEFEDRCAAL